MILSGASLSVKKFELKKPYVLSFATIECLSSIQLTLEIDNDTYTAEVVPLVGYNDESEEIITSFLGQWIKNSIGKEILELRQLAKEKTQKTPFSVSPILQAIDLYLLDFKPTKNFKNLDCVVPISHKDIEKSQLDPSLDYKLKLSGDINIDISSLVILQEEYDGLKVRTDANQIYNRQDSFDFYNRIRKDNLNRVLHYIEQPVSYSDWNLIIDLKTEFPEIPMMLDESVISDDQILKAKEIGIEFIKLKLFKQGGIIELIQQSNLISILGMKVVLGNGVATNLSNSIENTLYQSNRNLYFGASEGNGFLKIF